MALAEVDICTIHFNVSQQSPHLDRRIAASGHINQLFSVVVITPSCSVVCTFPGTRQKPMHPWLTLKKTKGSDV